MAKDYLPLDVRDIPDLVKFETQSTQVLLRLDKIVSKTYH